MKTQTRLRSFGAGIADPFSKQILTSQGSLTAPFFVTSPPVPPSPPAQPIEGFASGLKKLHSPSVGGGSPAFWIGAPPRRASAPGLWIFLPLNKSEKGKHAKLLISLDPNRATLLDQSSNLAISIEQK